MTKDIKLKDDSDLRIISLLRLLSSLQPPEGLLLETGKLYLGRTLEYTKTDKYVPMLEGRSSIGRLGLFIHVTAGFGDVVIRLWKYSAFNLAYCLRISRKSDIYPVSKKSISIILI